MPARTAPRFLTVAASAQQAQALAMALDAARFEAEGTSFDAAALGQGLQRFSPSLVLAHCEPGSPPFKTLAAELERAGQAELPVVLLVADARDDVFVRPMTRGVVELLEAPFNPRLHVARLRTLTVELPERSGLLKGRGGQGEVPGALQHLMKTGRTGTFAVGPEGAESGQVTLSRGRPRTAKYKSLSGPQALSAVVRSVGEPWRWTDETGNASMFDVGEDEFAQVAEQQMTASVQAPPRQAAPPAPAPAPSALPPTDPDAARTPLLLVDDDPTLVTMLAEYFGKRGYPVQSAEDGVEALKLLLARHFELVIIDLNMPRLDGWGLLRVLREDYRTHETPVALFSAHDDYRDSLRLLHAGAQAYFPKTIRMAALETQVRELVEPRRRFRRLLQSEGGFTHDFTALGVQWVLRTLEGFRFTGRLDAQAKDGWAQWRAWFEKGRLRQVEARVGQNTWLGDRALTSLLSAKSAEGTLSPGLTDAPGEGFAQHPTDSTLKRVVPWMAEEAVKAREDSLARAKALTVHPELYALYVTVGPPAWLPIARMLCEQKLPPAQVISQLGVTPGEVAQVVKDLLRRGVATLEN